MRVSVVIPAWNLWEVTAACLRSLASCSPPGGDGGGVRLEVVVVDNGSTDATATELAPLGEALWGADFRRVRLPRNEGFARGCNAGARAAGGEALFFCNNDVTFTPGWAGPLVRAVESALKNNDAPAGRRPVGAAGPLLLYPDGACQHCGVSFSPFRQLEHLYRGFPGDHRALRSVHPLQAITGAALLVPRGLFFAAGGFNEDYLNGFEDLDFCFTLRQMGYRLAVAPESVLCHHESRTPGRADKDDANAALFSRRWGHICRADLHVQAAVDGYETRISRLGDSYLALPAAREAALEEEARRFMGGLPPEAGRGALERALKTCRALLHAEPLWLGGRLRVGDLLLRMGRAAEALAHLGRAVRDFPVPAAQLALMRAARLAGDEKLAAMLAAGLAPDAARTAQLKEKIRLFRRRAAENREDALVGIFDAWLAEADGNARPHDACKRLPDGVE